MLIDSLCDLRENRARSLAWEQQAAALHTLLSFYECVEAIACSCCAQTTELCYVGLCARKQEKFHLHKSLAALVYCTCIQGGVS